MRIIKELLLLLRLIVMQNLDDLFNLAASKQEDPFFIILDELEDPHNLGSIMRTADAVRCSRGYYSKKTCGGLTAVVAKASTGAIEHIPVVRANNLSQTVDELKNVVFGLRGQMLQGSADYRNMDATLPLAIIIGSEGKGMRRLLKENVTFFTICQWSVMLHRLNASVAALSSCMKCCA